MREKSVCSSSKKSGLDSFSEKLNNAVKVSKHFNKSTSEALTNIGRLQFRGEYASKEVLIWINTGIFDRRQTRLCASYKNKKWVHFKDIDNIDKPPRHYNCRSHIIASKDLYAFDKGINQWKKEILSSRYDELKGSMSEKQFNKYRAILADNKLLNINDKITPLHKAEGLTKPETDFLRQIKEIGK